MTVVNLRGTNGAGKSTIVRQLLDSYVNKPVYGLFGPRRPEAYKIELPGIIEPVFILGAYETNCGGADAVKPYDLILYLLTKYAAKGNIIFEGALISGCYGEIGEWLEKHGKDAAILFIDTPLKVCLERVKARTKDAGTKNIEARYKSIQKVRERMIKDGKLRVLDISTATGAETVLKLLRGEKPEGIIPERNITERVSGIESFGARLIETRDLDPLYCGLVGADLPRDQLYRFLLAYLMFYHVGVSAYLSEHEGAEYWARVMRAAENTTAPRSFNLPGERWPRASERRHFRGQKGIDAVEYLSKKFPRPESAIESLLQKPDDKSIMEAVKTWPEFGPWASFKAADVIERVVGTNVQISADIVLMYNEPRKALDVLAPGKQQAEYNRLLDHFSAFKAPPRDDRPCGPAEVESVLCKFKSYLGGHYWIGKDIHEHRAALIGWGATAEKLLAAYPAEVARQFNPDPL